MQQGGYGGGYGGGGAPGGGGGGGPPYNNPGPYGPPPAPPNPYAMVPVQQQHQGWPQPGGYALAAMQQAPYGVHPRTGIPYSDKSKMVAGLLQIFLGKFGVGRFYTGHTGLAIGQLCACLAGVWILSWFTCGISIGVILWPIIDGIVLMSTDSKDAQGRMLRS